MVIKNRMGKAFGTPLAFSGWLFMIAGVNFIRQAMGMAMVIAGAFLAFTGNGVLIDPEKSRIKAYTSIFGVIPAGKWQEISSFGGLTIVPVKRSSVIYSRSNRQNTTEVLIFAVYLLDKLRKPSLAIKNCADQQEAQIAMDDFSLLLHLPVCKV